MGGKQTLKFVSELDVQTSNLNTKQPEKCYNKNSKCNREHKGGRETFYLAGGFEWLRAASRRWWHLSCVLIDF